MDKRGFRYELEPLQTRCDWEMQHLRLAISRLNTLRDDQQAKIEQLEAALAGANQATAGQAVRSFHIDQHRIAVTHGSQLAQRLAGARQAVVDTDAELGRAVALNAQLKRFSERLDEQRDEALAEFVREQERRAAAESDDAWLRATHGRNEA
jgi:hypothetical protein